MSGIKKVLQDYLYDATKNAMDVLGWDIPVIHSKQNGLEPENTYCVIDILELQRVGRVLEATFIAPPENNELWSIANYNLYTQYRFIGDQADDYGFDFGHHITNNRRFIEEFEKKKLAVTRRSNMRNQPQLRETMWKPSQNMDLTFSLAIQTRQTVDWVEFITVNGETYRIYDENI